MTCIQGADHGRDRIGGDTEVYPSFLKNLLDMKFKVISGYPGSREINLAIERKRCRASA